MFPFSSYMAGGERHNGSYAPVTSGQRQFLLRVAVTSCLQAQPCTRTKTKRHVERIRGMNSDFPDSRGGVVRVYRVGDTRWARMSSAAWGWEELAQLPPPNPVWTHYQVTALRHGMGVTFALITILMFLVGFEPGSIGCSSKRAGLKPSHEGERSRV